MLAMPSIRTTVSALLLASSVCSLPAWAESRCTDTKKNGLKPATVSCTYEQTEIDSGSVGKRQVIYQTPLGTPPAEGWPVVVIYQGSFFPLKNFTYNSLMPFGGYYQGKVIQTLLDHGYAVIAPSALADLFWQTNIPPFDLAYEQSNDFTFLNNVLQAMQQGRFGTLNKQRQYATGISSGGYNTSRMAVSFQGQFKALVIQSGSYANCGGPLCVVPKKLPADHPPTYFLQGFIDPIVPWWTAEMYHKRLAEQGIETGMYTDKLGGHEWFPASPEKVLEWFNRHP
jgi:predicted esterase